MNTSSKLLSSLIFSETYAKIKDSFGSVDTSYYGDLEVVKFKIQNGHYQGQVKMGTQIKHGRGCHVFEHDDGRIELIEGFFFNGKPHGPCNYFKPNGGKYKVWNYFHGEKTKKVRKYELNESGDFEKTSRSDDDDEEKWW